MAGRHGQRPVDVRAQESKGKAYGRQAIWETLRAECHSQRWWTLSDLALVVHQPKRTVQNYCDALVAGGYADTKKVRTNSVGRQNTTHTVYHLIKDIGVQAPRINAKGETVVTNRDHMWRCMKMLSSFSAVDLAVAASTEDCAVSPVDASSYCTHLHKAGYLLCVTPATYQSKAVYKLRPVMSTGPHAPMVQRTKVVFDPNLQRIMWHEDMEP